MGCCCSCFGSDESKGGAASSSSTTETELSAQGSKGLAISRAMSAPSIEVEHRTKVSGYGLALASVAIEQDSAYWEAHIEIIAERSSIEVMFGVATKKDRQFFKDIEKQQETAEKMGTDYMRKIKVSNGDIVGIAVQQADLPMVQFLLNGEPLHDLAVNRFRGMAHPAIYLPEGNEGLQVRLVFNESEFKHEAPNVRFGPVIVARGII